MPPDADILVLCRCRYGQLVSPSALEAVRAGLASSGAAVVEVDDLCELAERKHELLKRIVASGRAGILACFPRAVRWLFHSAGLELGPDVRLLNLRAQGPADVLAELGIAAGAGPLRQRPERIASPGDWTPWFPVIDYDRCDGCGQCQNFCLFGVYEPDDRGQVHVAHPRNCKMNCPACARVCPRGAIVFPKYKDAPVNGDDSAGPAGADLGALVGPDVYAALRQRGGGKRFATEQEIQEGVQKAIQERLRCGKPSRPASARQADPGRSLPDEG